MKKMVKEIPFGKGIARVEVAVFTTENTEWLTENVETATSVKIIAGDRVVAEAYHANTLEYNFLTDTFFEKYNLDENKKYTKVGNIVTEGTETAEAINNAIEDMKAELLNEYNTKTEAAKQHEEDLAQAEEIIAQAKKEGVENLMSKSEIKSWRTRYNDIHNEGGEGFIPRRISKEAYSRALAFRAASASRY